MQYIYCNTFTAIVRGAYTGEAKMCKNALKWLIFKLPARITGKRLKIDGIYSVLCVYTPSIVTMAVSATIFEIFNVKECTICELFDVE